MPNTLWSYLQYTFLSHDGWERISSWLEFAILFSKVLIHNLNCLDILFLQCDKRYTMHNSKLTKILLKMHGNTDPVFYSLFYLYIYFQNFLQNLLVYIIGFITTAQFSCLATTFLGGLICNCDFFICSVNSNISVMKVYYIVSKNHEEGFFFPFSQSHWVIRKIYLTTESWYPK